MPKVVVPSQQALFAEVKKATQTKILVPPPVVLHSQLMQVPTGWTPPESHLPSVVQPVKTVKAVKAVKKVQPIKTVLAKKVVLTLSPAQPTYTLQLASFVRPPNAQLLVKRLRAIGYNANTLVVSTPQGAQHKVLVRGLKGRDEAHRIQKKLATELQLNGFILPSAVG